MDKNARFCKKLFIKTKINNKGITYCTNFLKEKENLIKNLKKYKSNLESKIRELENKVNLKLKNYN